MRLVQFALRPQESGDETIVRRAHVAHRADLFAGMPLPIEAVGRICDQQHDLQERHIRDHHPRAERLMIVQRRRVVGRVVLDRRLIPWRIIDLALVPEAQSQGIGTSVLRGLIQDASFAGAMLELQVGMDNPRAERLYRRLGFIEAMSTSPTHRRLVHGTERRPTALRANG